MKSKYFKDRIELRSYSKIAYWLTHQLVADWKQTSHDSSIVE